MFVPAFDDAKALADSLPFASAVAHVLIPRARMLYYRFRGRHTLTKVGPETFEANGAIMGKIGAFLGARKIAHHFVFLPSRVSFDDALYANYSRGGTVFPEQDFLHHYGRPICAGRNLSCPAVRGSSRRPAERARSLDGHRSAARTPWPGGFSAGSSMGIWTGRFLDRARARRLQS